MVSITLAVPAELKTEMDNFPEMNWSAVARGAIERKIQLLKQFQEFTKDSEMTEADALKLGKKVNATVAKRHRE